MYHSLSLVPRPIPSFSMFHATGNGPGDEAIVHSLLLNLTVVYQSSTSAYIYSTLCMPCDSVHTYSCWQYGILCLQTVPGPN